MKLRVTSFLLMVASASAFTVAQRQPIQYSAHPTGTTPTALAMTTAATEINPFVQGPRIAREELPVVYVYDHCPFCVRVRLALGIMNVKHNVFFLANDDIPTPTKLVGKKIAPIFVSSLKV
jgi:hypothetical protein